MSGSTRNRVKRATRAFPWLEEDESFTFPPLAGAYPDGVLCVGGNLSPGMLLSAYRQGVFPWFNDDDPIIWWSPDPRFVLIPSELHVSKTMRKILKKRRFELSLDTDFAAVIRACAGTPRPGQGGTWITEDMVAGYKRLFDLGWAHSVEARLDGRLVGGLYGIAIGSAFFGESMFSLEPDASKAAFIPLVWRLCDEGFTLIDSQVRTDHVASMGGRSVDRETYLSLLSAALQAPNRRGSWSEVFPGFPDSTAYRSLSAQVRSGVSSA